MYKVNGTGWSLIALFSCLFPFSGYKMKYSAKKVLKVSA